MSKYMAATTVLLFLLNGVVSAAPVAAKPGTHKPEMGLGLGAVIGGLLGGPPGAIIGAAGGAWLGDRQKKKDDTLSDLEKKLQQKQTELAGLQQQFARLESSHDSELHRVNMEKQVSAVEKLSDGVFLNIYFRTNSAALGPQNDLGIEHLAHYLKDLPEISVDLEGHADRRGTDAYNIKLSQQRAETIRQALIRNGLAENRIHCHGYGESGAKAARGDIEGYIFDRRVRIKLTLRHPAYAVNQRQPGRR